MIPRNINRYKIAAVIGLATLGVGFAAERQTMYVDGTDRKDGCGNKIVIRGFNAMTLYWDGYGGQNGNWDKAGDYNFSQINKTGANCVRIMWASVHGGEGWRMPVAGLEASINIKIKL